MTRKRATTDDAPAEKPAKRAKGTRRKKPAPVDDRPPLELPDGVTWNGEPDLVPLLVPIAELEFDPDNLNEHPDENLDEIERAFRGHGQMKPGVARARDGVVVAGNGGMLVARDRLGWTHFAVVRSARGDAQLARYAVADNLTGRSSRFDDARLGAFIRALEPGEVSETGIGDRGLAALLRRLDPGGAPERTGPAFPKAHSPFHEKGTPSARVGDVYALGAHRLICGDSLHGDAIDVVLRNDAGEPIEADAVVIDPPYAIFGSSTGVGSDVADDAMVRPFFELVARTCYRRLKWYGHAYVFTDWRSWSTLWEASRRESLKILNMLIWSKPGLGMGSHYGNAHELIAFASKHPEQLTTWKGKPPGQRLVHERNTFEICRPQGAERQHAAAKPVELILELVRNSTDVGEVVLDAFCGSGPTIVACEKLDRRCIAAENAPKYVDVAVSRWEQLTGKKAELIARAEPPAEAEPAA